MLQAERNKLKMDLEAATTKVNQEVAEKEKVITEKNSLQTVNIQLRNLARKYREQLSSTNSGKNTECIDKEVQVDAAPLADDDTSSESSRKQLDELQHKVAQKEEANAKLAADIDRLTQENKNLLKVANEKDDCAKKIAERAKQRISELTIEKKQAINDIHNKTKEIEQLKTKILELQTSIAHKEKQIDSLNKQSARQQDTVSQFEAGASLSSGPVAIQTLTSLDSSSMLSGTNNIASTCASTRSVQSQQQQQGASPSQTAAIAAICKTTPTASIRPLTVAAASRSLQSLRGRGASISGHRPITMVIPTASVDEGTSSSQVVLQATVQPTQPQITASSSMTVSSTAITPSVAEISEVSTSLPSFPSSVIQFSQPSTSTGGFTTAASSSEVHKRAFETSDEPSSSSVAKKAKVSTESPTSRNDSPLENIEDEREEEEESEESGTSIEVQVGESDLQSDAETELIEADESAMVDNDVDYDDTEQQQQQQQQQQSQEEERSPERDIYTGNAPEIDLNEDSNGSGIDDIEYN